jgi:hypothetical protein
MKTLDPSNFALGLPSGQLKWAQSQHGAVNGQLDLGVPQSKDSSGNFNTFKDGNSNGILIRVSPNGGIDNENSWGAINTAIPINHGLLDQNRNPRQPVGVHLVSSDKALSIWQPTTPDTKNVYVAPSDPTAYATLYVF